MFTLATKNPIDKKNVGSLRKVYYPIKNACTNIYSNAKNEICISLAKARRFIIPVKTPDLNNEINLHLGCGSINHPKFINIDGLPAPHVHYIRSLDNLSIFKSNTVDLIYASHCLEHFPYHKVQGVLGEWYRVLKKDGTLRLSVPDFDLLLNIYRESGNDIDSIMSALMGGQDYKYNFHMSVFTRSKLFSMLKNNGFKYIQEWKPFSCDLTSFQDHASCKFIVHGKPYPVSLNLEAIK
jgi:predicted SAM-dependent methyltransferase